MKIAIRTDASSQIGIGHFMRCLTLADAFKQHRADICFVSRCLPEYLRDMTRAKDYELIMLDGGVDKSVQNDQSYSHWLGTSQYNDAHDTIHVLYGKNYDLMVVDHYALDVQWESELRHAVNNVLVIDDLADRQHDCDILLDQNYYDDGLTRYDSLTPEDCCKLLGPEFSLLRNEFAVARRSLRKRDGNIKRILIFFGGSDLENQTLRTLQVLQKINQFKMAIDVVIGIQNPYRDEIDAFAAESKKVTAYFNVSNMARLIADADLYIGAAGTTTWERCCLGLPSLVITVAPNQEQATIDLEKLGVLTYLGESSLLKAEQITTAVTDCLSGPLQMLRQSEKSLSLVDGLGASRCAETIIQLIM